MSKRLAAIGMKLDKRLILPMNDLNCFSDFQLGLDLDRFFFHGQEYFFNQICLDSLLLFCLELLLTPVFSMLESSDAPIGGSNFSSLSSSSCFFPLNLSATFWTPLLNAWSARFSHSARDRSRF